MSTNSIDSIRPIPLLSSTLQPAHNHTVTTPSASSIRSLSPKTEENQGLWQQFCRFLTALLDFFCCRSKPPVEPLAPQNFPTKSAPIGQEPLQRTEELLSASAQESLTPAPSPQKPLCYFPSQEEIYLLLRISCASNEVIHWITPFFFEILIKSISHEFSYSVRDPYTIGHRIKEIYRLHCLSADKMKETRDIGDTVAIVLATPLFNYIKNTAATEMRPVTPLPSFNFLSKVVFLQNRQEARAWIQARWIDEDAFDSFVTNHMNELDQLPQTQRIWILYELLSHLRLVSRLISNEELQEAHNWLHKRAQAADHTLHYQQLEHAVEEFATLPAYQQLWILYLLLISLEKCDPEQQNALQSIIQTYSIRAIPT